MGEGEAKSAKDGDRAAGRRHENTTTLQHCLDEYRRQTKGTDEQYRIETLVCRKPEEGAGNEQEAPGASHTAGSESSYTAGTGAPAVIHQGSDRSDQMMRSQDSNNSYELDPAGTELCITADISRTYPVGMQRPVLERVPRWCATLYAVVPLKEPRASRWEGLRGKVSAHVLAQSSKRRRWRLRAKKERAERQDRDPWRRTTWEGRHACGIRRKGTHCGGAKAACVSGRPAPRPSGQTETTVPCSAGAGPAGNSGKRGSRQRAKKRRSRRT